MCSYTNLPMPSEHTLREHSNKFVGVDPEFRLGLSIPNIRMFLKLVDKDVELLDEDDLPAAASTDIRSFHQSSY